MSEGAPAILLRRAVAGDATRLTEIAFAAKRHWRYPEDWIERWRGMLTLTPDRLGALFVCVAVVDGESVGFCGVEFISGEAVLEHLWIVPTWMGHGIGRRLFAEAEREARSRGMRALRIESDPHAEAFYQRMGAQTVGCKPASMDGIGRFLPLLRKEL